MCVHVRMQWSGDEVLFLVEGSRTLFTLSLLGNLGREGAWGCVREEDGLLTWLSAGAGSGEGTTASGSSLS